MANLGKKFGRDGDNKRKHDRNPAANASHENEANKKMKATNEGEDVEMEEALEPHTRLTDEIRSQPAKQSSNQKLVDAFLAYGVKQLMAGHTGKAMSHIRAAQYIRDHNKPIRSATDARAVNYVGDKMAAQIEEVLRSGKVPDKSANMNVSDESTHKMPELVTKVRDTPAKCKENQPIVDALAKFGEHELLFGNSGKGVTHLRAANEIHNADMIIKSGSDAQHSIPLIGDVIGDKIDQILQHGRIFRDTGATSLRDGSHRPAGSLAPIVEHLLTHPPKVTANQKIVDALIDYGDSHLQSGTRGKGISHLRAAKGICYADFEIKSAEDATKIDMVGPKVAAKIEQILDHGHADSDTDYEDEEEEEYEDEGEVGDDGGGKQSQEYGRRELDRFEAPIIRDIRGAPAEVADNQKLVDALAEYAEDQLSKRHTGRGITYARAARQLRDATEAVSSGKEARQIAVVGDKVALFIDKVLTKGNTRQNAAP